MENVTQGCLTQRGRMPAMSATEKPFVIWTYRCHTHPKCREITFTRERSKVRSLVRPPGPSIKSDAFVRVAKATQKSFRLNPEQPNCNDGPEHGQAGNRPARYVNSTIRFRPVHHRI